MNLNDYKKCGKCFKVFLKANFFNNKARYDGLSGHCKICHQKDTKNRNDKLRNQCLEKYGSKCKNCGFSDTRALQFDHVNSDGSIDLAKGIYVSWNHYKKILNDDSGIYQLLCANCNWIKRYTHDELMSRTKIEPITDEATISAILEKTKSGNKVGSKRGTYKK